jgi:hypothetical protein
MKVLMNDFSQWQVHGVGHTVNGVAHTIARIAAREGLNMTWLGVFPDCIRDIILRERIVSIA